ncbi:MAG TPA: NADH-ubiquinone oxidoreductase-F iron-sulfur binding region domain-containing protein [Chitinophagales bacterium]|nr:NADH-ubiquinone oxidoreductase-F iron-sulfur binding region domain-containing protein [Chitinophagales bacterium]HRK26135.1 NADH-ubiquinone oxidoreductase-F iron-sulfur binding region domain-containing protein [Chitinophagales bacterium]
MSKNLSFLSGRKGLEHNLFEALANKAAQTGTPSIADIEQLAEDFLMGNATLYGATTFYDFLKPENQGKKAYVCNGSACLTAGTQEAVKAELLRHFAPDEIGEMCCLGRCHENGAFQVGGVNYSGSSVGRLDKVLSGIQSGADRYAVKHIGTPVLTAPLPNVDSYYQLWRQALQTNPLLLLEQLKTSGLRGRGGAGFPMSFKLESCRNTPSEQKFLVCNADEGDPGAYSDRYLMEQRPHAVLLGMMLAGYMMGASWGVLYIRAEYPESVMAIEQAIQDLYSRGLLGEDILGSGFTFRFKVIKAQGAYICGEETALLSSIEGQRPEVRVRPPYPTQQGLFNMPTVVNNVETLACVPYIITNGGATFAAIGRGKSTGTKLLSLDGHFNRPGLYEVDMGTPLLSVIEDLGRGFSKPVKALHIGGPLGGLVPVHKIFDLTVDFESFAQNGFLLGHASVVCIPDEFPIITYLQHLFEFTAHESCGKCFPCRLGSTRGAELLQKAQSDATYKIDKTLFTDLLETLEIGSLCALGGGLPLPVKNALQYFEPELRGYFG